MLVTACWSIDSTMHASEKIETYCTCMLHFGKQWCQVSFDINFENCYVYAKCFIFWGKFWNLWIESGKKKLFLWFCCFCCILICFCYNLALCCLRQHYSKILVIITVRTLKLWTLDMFLCIFQWLWKEESFYNA